MEKERMEEEPAPDKVVLGVVRLYVLMIMVGQSILHKWTLQN